MKYSCQTFWPSAVCLAKNQLPSIVSTHTLGEGVSWVENLELTTTYYSHSFQREVSYS